MSPSCTHFSKAKGSKPLDRNIRSLAEVAHRWVAEVRPRVIVVENVVEWLSWGPLLEDGRPDPAREGESFREWLARLRARGYVAEWRELRAAQEDVR